MKRNKTFFSSVDRLEILHKQLKMLYQLQKVIRVSQIVVVVNQSF